MAVPVGGDKEVASISLIPLLISGHGGAAGAGVVTAPLSKASLSADTAAIQLLSVQSPQTQAIRLRALSLEADVKSGAAITIAGTGGVAAEAGASVEFHNVSDLNKPVSMELQNHAGKPIEDAKEDLSKDLEKVRSERTSSGLSKILKGLAVAVLVAALVCALIFSGGIFGIVLMVVIPLATGVAAHSLESSIRQESKDSPKFDSMDKAFKTPEGQKKYNDEIDARKQFYKPAHDSNTTDADVSKWKANPEVYGNIRAKEFALKEIDEERQRELKALGDEKGMSDEHRAKKNAEINKSYDGKYTEARAKLDREEVSLFRDIGMLPKTAMELEVEGLNPQLAAGTFHANEPRGLEARREPLAPLDQEDVKAQLAGRGSYYTDMSSQGKKEYLGKVSVRFKSNYAQVKLAHSGDEDAIAALTDSHKAHSEARLKDFQQKQTELNAQVAKLEAANAPKFQKIADELKKANAQKIDELDKRLSGLLHDITVLEDELGGLQKILPNAADKAPIEKAIAEKQAQIKKHEETTKKLNDEINELKQTEKSPAYLKATAGERAKVDEIRDEIRSKLTTLAKNLDQNEIEFYESIGKVPSKDLENNQRASLMPGQFHRNYLGTLFDVPPQASKQGAHLGAAEEDQKKNH